VNTNNPATHTIPCASADTMSTPRMTSPAALRRALGVGKRVTVNPAFEPDIYVAATVRALVCTLALFTVLALALVWACAPPALTVGVCSAVSHSAQRRHALKLG
jgi:hypothetical protein